MRPTFCNKLFNIIIMDTYPIYRNYLLNDTGRTRVITKYFYYYQSINKSVFIFRHKLLSIIFTSHLVIERFRLWDVLFNFLFMNIIFRLF